MAESSKRRFLVVHQAVVYPSTETGGLVEHRAGEEVTDIAPDNWLITEGLVVRLHQRDDPAALLDAYAAAQPPVDTVVEFVPADAEVAL